MDISTLAKRARLQRVSDRAHDIDGLREMLDGTYTPDNGLFMPPFTIGSTRHKAFQRAMRTTNTVVPVVVNKSLAALDFGNITWSDADTGEARADDVVAALPLARIARDLAIELKLGGAMAAIASTPVVEGRTMAPTIDVLHGVNIPYTDPTAPGRVSGWFRAIEYTDDKRSSQLRWWVEAYEFLESGNTIHRVWESLINPTDLATTPDREFESTARPRYYVQGVQPDGMPVSPMLANLGRILGLYATELRLATTEELSAFPMLLVKGDAAVDQVGPAENIAVDAEGDARWLDPGDLSQLREQVVMKRDQIREAFSLPAGSLGAQTPSGEALSEANRGFMQDTRSTADALSTTLTEVTNDYLALLGIDPVQISVPIDRAYTTEALAEIVEKGIDLGVLPKKVAARMFQTFVGTSYSDDELEEFIAEIEERANVSTPGFLPAREEVGETPPDLE